MPIMNGYEATTQVIEYLKNQGLSAPPIIAVSGHTDKHHKDLCLNAGMEYVIHKPVNP